MTKIYSKYVTNKNMDKLNLRTKDGIFACYFNLKVIVDKF